MSRGAAMGLVGVRRSTPTRSVRGGRAPVVTLALAAVAIVVALAPPLQRLLILDRDRIASGELWRIATGNVVHFSATHLGYDLLVVVAFGATIERSGQSLLPVLTLSALSVGGSVLLFAPDIERYGGLSGVACALVVLAALDGLGSPGLTRATSTALLAIVAAKLAWEASSGAFLFVSDAAHGVFPVPVAHIAGAAVGVIARLLPRAARTA